MSDYDDDWMHNPTEMDDWINTLEDETKNAPRRTGGGPGGGGGCGSGCFVVVIAVVGIIVLIALITSVFKPGRPSNYNSNPSTGITQESQKCGFPGCDKLHMAGGGYHYCYEHTCEILRCKDKVVSGTRFCSEHQPSKYNSNSSNKNKSSVNKGTTKKNKNEYNASDYDDPDDFYDDYYYDFEDYDEAEQYWDENH